MAENLSAGNGSDEVSASRPSPQFSEEARRLATLFSEVEQRGQMEELRTELDRAKAAGEENVSAKFYRILGIAPEEADQLIANLRELAGASPALDEI